MGQIQTNSNIQSTAESHSVHLAAAREGCAGAALLWARTCPKTVLLYRRHPLVPSHPPYFIVCFLTFAGHVCLCGPASSPRFLRTSTVCCLYQPGAFFGLASTVSSMRPCWPNFILHWIPLVWIRTHTEVHAHTHTHSRQSPETSAQMSAPETSGSSRSAGG